MEQFGRYQLQSLLGRGGMGEVFRAYDTEHQREVAVKRLAAHLVDDVDFRTRFAKESQLVARLNAPHIVPIHDFGEINGHLFIDMRMVEGAALSDLLQRHGPMPIASAIDIVAQVASALDAAHHNRLVHRDIKPSNVLLSPDRSHTSGYFAYLVDFGIARSMPNTGVEGTAVTATTGTVAYMAPERFAGNPGDHRVDVYALGCLLYECLTAKHPFVGEPLAIMYQHVNAAPPDAATLRPDVPPALAAVIAKAMEKYPDDRWPSAGDLAAAAAQAYAAGASSPAGSPQTVVGMPFVATDLPTASPAAPAVPPSLPPARLRDRARPAPKRRSYAMMLVPVGCAVAGGALLFSSFTPNSASNSSAIGGGEPAPGTTTSASSGPPLVGGEGPGGVPLPVGPITIDDQSAYFPNPIGNSIAIVDIAKRTIGPAHPAGPAPSSITLNGDKVYVTNPSSGTISVLDATSGKLTATIRVGGSPTSIQPDPNGGDTAFVVNAAIGSVDVVDTAKNRLVRHLVIGNGLAQLAFSPSDALAYAVSAESDTVTAIDTDTGFDVRSLIVPGTPNSVAVAPNDGNVYIGTSSDVIVVDAKVRRIIRRIPVGTASAVAFSFDGASAYIGDPQEESVVAVSTTTGKQLANIQVGIMPTSVTTTPDGTQLLVCHGGLVDGGVTFIDLTTNTLDGDVLTGGSPAPPLITGSGNYALVQHEPFAQISMLDLAHHTIVATLVPR